MNKNLLKIDFYKPLNNIFESYEKNKFRIINFIKKIRYILLIKICMHMINNFQKYIRNNIGFEINDGSFKRIQNLINENLTSNLNIFIIIKKYLYYFNRLKSISLDKPKYAINTLVISNRYIDLNLYYDYELEKIISNNNMIPIRYITNIKSNKLKDKYYLYKIKKYCRHNIGSNIIRNIYLVKKYIDKGNISVVFIKTNIDEDIVTSIILKSICDKENIPYIYLNFNEDINRLYLENNISALKDIINIFKAKK